MTSVTIDNEMKLRSFLAHVANQLSEERLVFVDLEGVDLSRSGTVAIMQLLIPPSSLVYLVDVHVLGSRAFQLESEDGTSLRCVLESRTVFKVFFDIRNDSDALFAHYGINLAGVIDVQVIEYATRQPRGRFVNGLAKCIDKDLPYVPGRSAIKANGRRLFAPEVGGSYEVFLERPIPPAIMRYCEQDVMLLPQLLACYGPKLRDGIASQIQNIVDERIRLSKTATYSGKGRHMAVGPYIGPASVAHRHVSPEVEVVQSVRLLQLCRIDPNLSCDLISRLDAINPQAMPAFVDSPANQAEESELGKDYE